MARQYAKVTVKSRQLRMPKLALNLKKGLCKEGNVTIYKSKIRK